jgi:ArsR family transcriptional regulator
MEEKMATYFKALGDKNRLILFEQMLKGETCGCTLINKVEVTQPTMTYHLNILEEASLISSRKEGIWRKLDVNDKIIDDMINYLNSLKKLKGTDK